MKALVFSSTKKLIYKTVPKPKLKKNETLIKVLATGICGSDMHAFNGLDKVKKKPPIILGHEVIGINLQKNKYCAINPIISCSKCEYCKKNMEHLCSKLSMIGMTKPIKKNGGFAELLSIPRSNVLNIPKNKNLYNFTLIEPTAVALHAINLSKKHIDKDLSKLNILIIGAGSIGLLIALILKSKKINKLNMVDFNFKKLEIAKKHTNTSIFQPHQKKLLQQRFDIIYDAVGTNNSREQALNLIKSGGLIMHIGLSEINKGINFLKLTRNEVKLIGSYAYTNKEFKNSLTMISKNKLGNLSWKSFTNLKNGQKIFESINTGKSISPKIILTP